MKVVLKGDYGRVSSLFASLRVQRPLSEMRLSRRWSDMKTPPKRRKNEQFLIFHSFILPSPAAYASSNENDLPEKKSS